MDLQSKIRVIEDFPKAGISFKDITTLLQDKEAFRYTIDAMAQSLSDKKVDVIAGPEARGFLLGTAVAYALGVGFVPIRKPGKLPFQKIVYEYDLEYGKDCLEMHIDALKPGQRVGVVDDLLATGGTVQAVAGLIERQGAVVAGLEFLIELEFLSGRSKLTGYPVHSLVRY